MKIFHFNLHFSELIASFFMVLGGLLVWTMINRKEGLFKNELVKKAVAGFMIGVVTLLGMVVGWSLTKGHSWGNPTTAMALAMQHTWSVFTNHDNLLLIGMLYIVFQIIGAALAFGVYILYVWAYNFTEKDVDNRIYLSKIFKLDQSPATHVALKDGIAALFFAFAVIGASNFQDTPKPFQTGMTAFSTAMIVSLVTMMIVMLFGVRSILALNPLVWASAFVIKMTTAFYLERKTITMKVVLTELLSPVMIIGTAAMAGLGMWGMISLAESI